MALPAVTEIPPAHLPDPWPSAQEALAAARTVSQVAKEVYGDRLVEVWMYGSRARGDWTDESDLDLLIVLDKDLEPLSRRWRLLPELRGELINRYEYITQSMVSLRGSTPERMGSWDTTFYRSVRRDAIRIL